MNSGPMNREPMAASGSDRFDAAIRAYHADALARLSPRVQAQLAQRRNAALRGEARTVAARPHRLRFAVAGIAALCALALGMRFYPQSPGGAPSAAPATASIQYASGSTALEEDPDFYAWLGSSDAPLLAME
jgi:hypothetical protein